MFAFFNYDIKLIESKRYWSYTQLAEQEFRLNRIREGERKFWHRNGQLCEQEFYRNGKLEGERKEWYENGQLADRAFYKNGNREGERKRWSENGMIEVKSICRDGVLDGEYKSWDNGRPMEHTFHRRGFVIDPYFSNRKKNVFVRLKRKFRKHAIGLIDTVLISDLRKVACL